MSIENIRANINNELARAKALCLAWESVTFNYKKDGTPFRLLSQCFNNARITSTYSGKVLCISASYNEYNCYRNDYSIHYNSDSINLSYDVNTAKSLGFTDVNKVDNDRYHCDFNEMYQLIKQRIETYKKGIKELEHQLNGLEFAYNSFDVAITQAINALKVNSGYEYSHELYNKIVSDKFKETRYL